MHSYYQKKYYQIANEKDGKSIYITHKKKMDNEWLKYISKNTKPPR